MDIIPIRVIPVSLEYVDPLKNINCVKTAPTLPPAPVIPDITPSDLYNQRANTLDNYSSYHADNIVKKTLPSRNEGNNSKGKSTRSLDEYREDEHNNYRP